MNNIQNSFKYLAENLKPSPKMAAYIKKLVISDIIKVGILVAIIAVVQKLVDRFL